MSSKSLRFLEKKNMFLCHVRDTQNYLNLAVDPQLKISCSRDLPQKQIFDLKKRSIRLYIQRFEAHFYHFSKNSRSTKLIARHRVARYELCRSAIFQ